jgi:uncharacterized Zn finger protein (UPF0148 family)
LSGNNGYICPNCKIPINKAQVICLSCGAQLRNVKSGAKNSSPSYEVTNEDRLMRTDYIFSHSREEFEEKKKERKKGRRKRGIITFFLNFFSQ